jgi:hypothetical protein
MSPILFPKNIFCDKQELLLLVVLSLPPDAFCSWLTEAEGCSAPQVPKPPAAEDASKHAHHSGACGGERRSLSTPQIENHFA